MRINFLPQLRLLNPSSLCHLPILPPMTFRPSIHPSRASPLFTRIFPFKLKYRPFSTRPFRSRSDFGPNKADARASKSLIEDEAELSDWVSEFRTRRADDSDSDLPRNRRNGDRGGGRDRSRGGDKWGVSVNKRKRESGEFDESTRGRGQVDSFSRNSWPNNRFGSDFDDGNESGRRNRSKFDSSSRNSWPKNRFGSEFGGSSRRKNGGQVDSFSRNSRPSNRFNSDFDGKNRKYNERRKGREGNNNSSNNSLMTDKKGKREKWGFIDDNDEDEDGGRGIDVDDDGERNGSMEGLGDLLSSEESDDIAEDDDCDNVAFEKKAASSLGLEKEVSAKDKPSSSRNSDSYLSETRFDQCSISPLSLKGIRDTGYEKMTVVQEATLPIILKGKDVLAKAKTGTGKTVAFLLPSIEVIVKSPPIDRDQKRPPFLVLVICPTRELATQAAKEANTLLKYHPSIGVQVVIGGTRLALEQKQMQANPCQILVATPGRLRDHLENTAGFATRLMGVKVLVLDEADRLLDMGFRKDIERIVAAVPKQRQTLLFSATVPEEVHQICHVTLKRDYEFINTVEEGTEDTHSQVSQMHMIAPLDKHFPLLYVLLKDHISDNVDYKVLVFCTTAMLTRMVADLLGELKLNVREIHSRKPQNYRTRVSDEFRKSKGLILVTSDVSARGVDYPDVTLVIQVGVPSDRDQYIHRLGRTGRKGKEGQGILLLAPWEEFFLSDIKDLPITKSPLPLVDPDTNKKVERALSHVEMKNKEAAYQAWLGYYNSNKKVGKDKYRLVELANEFSRSMGLDNPPAIPKLVLGKMGLRNIPGLRSK